MYDDEKWISEQFGQADLGDPRRARRAQMLALNMLKAPGKGIPEQTQTWGGAKAAYRLFGRPEVTREALMQPHFEQTLQACEARPGLMLFVQDTTELDFTHMRAAKGYGPIGNHAGCGLMVHSLMALGTSGEVFGLAAQRCWARSSGPTRKGTENSVQRKKRKGLESEVWPLVLESLGRPPAGHTWVSVGDRGSDSYDYWSRARRLGWHCLSRLFVDRRTTGPCKLLQTARALSSQGELVMPQRARPGQAARTLKLSLAWSAVQVCPPVNDPKYKGCEPLDASVLRVWDAQHGLEWILLFTGTLNSFDEAAQCVGWYEQRWSIEEFHKCLKSGCRIEHSQLKQARSVQALLGFSSIVAVRLLALARLARARPDEPAAQHIEASYLRVLCAMRKLPAELTVRAYWREVARMGGFLGRTHDRDPGWQTLWKGLEKLEAWVAAWLDGFEEGRTCG